MRPTFGGVHGQVSRSTGSTRPVAALREVVTQADTIGGRSSGRWRAVSGVHVCVAEPGVACDVGSAAAWRRTTCRPGGTRSSGYRGRVRPSCAYDHVFDRPHPLITHVISVSRHAAQRVTTARRSCDKGIAQHAFPDAYRNAGQTDF